MKFYLLLLVLIFPAFNTSAQTIEPKEKKGLYGFFNGKEMLLDYQYDSISKEYRNSYLVRRNNKWGAVDNGREIIPCRYDSMKQWYKKMYVASLDGKQGILDSTGHVKFDFLFEDIDHVEGDTQALVKYQGQWCLYKNGEFSYKEEDLIFRYAEMMPLFPGCGQDEYNERKQCAEEMMYKYIFQNIRYPVTARKKGIQGQVILGFVVAKNGDIKNVKVLRGIGGGCDEEAVLVISGMPNWLPGVKEGKNVAIQYTIPIKFVLQ